MAENTYKRNTLKPKEETKSKQKESVATENENVSSFKLPKFSLAFVRDKRFILACGFFLMICSFYFSVAMVSYFFTGDEDQSVVENWFSGSFVAKGAEISNWLGLMGAVVSHLLIFKWFGVASFLLMPLLFVFGYKIVFERFLLPVTTYLQISFFFLLWLSTTFGYVAYVTGLESVIGFLGGGIGYELAYYFNSLIGVGTFLLLAFSLVVFTLYFFNITRLVTDKKEVKDTSLENASTLSSKVEEEEEFEEDLEDELEENLDGIALISVTSNEVVEPISETEIEQVDENQHDNTAEKALLTAAALAMVAQAAESKELDLNTSIPFEIENQVVKQEKNASKDIDFEINIPEEVEEEFPELELQVPFEEEFAEDTTTMFEEQLSHEDLVAKYGPYDPTLELSGYKFPTVDLLNDYPTGKVLVTKEELEANKDKIVQTLNHFSIGITRISATIGPTVTLYEIVPDPGVRISKIKNLEDDIALNLAALGIRIIAPMPGKGTIGIEVPNKNKEVVPGKMVLQHEKFSKSEMDLPIALGKTISNEVFVADLAKMPHLLIAGATGQGKSVGLNMILASLLFKKHPAHLKFVLVDPKKVELSIYSKIERHFLAKIPGEDAAIITETKKVVNTLNSVCIEMDRRYELLKEAQCRNLKEYNGKFTDRKLNPEKGHRFLPYIVVVIDELADLMMTAGKEVETPIARIAQLARAVGIHLVVATQRPSVNVITGIIKANFPARLSFRVTQKIDSRTILDTGGADQLIGRGDMLLKLDNDITRIQCAFLDTPEVEHVSNFIGDQKGYSSAYLLPEFYGDDESGQGATEYSNDDLDALFVEASRLIVAHQQGSTSLIQRRMSLGYNRAGRIIDQMESVGIVGPFEGSKAREVLVKDEMSLEQLLKDKKII